MSQEQNNNKQRKEMNVNEIRELDDEELDELIKEVCEDKQEQEKGKWEDTFEQLQRMKICQDKYRRIGIKDFNKKWKKENLNKLDLYQYTFREGLYYYFNLSQSMILAEMDNSDTLLKYKYYQKKLREIRTYREVTKKWDHEEPTWDGYCKWQNEYKEKKAERKKQKEEAKPKKNN